MLFKLLISLGLLLARVNTFAEATKADKQFYRDMILRIRTQAEFKVPQPNGKDMHFSYKMDFDKPMWAEPISSDLPTTSEPQWNKFIRYFYDKIFTKEGSYIDVGGEQIPLTCVFVSGQDNRRSGKSGPLIPDYILKITFVANDWACLGPINPGWPGNGAKKESWETYVHYEVRDPTIMLPKDVGLRYRWSEFEAVLVK